LGSKFISGPNRGRWIQIFRSRDEIPKK